MKRQYPESESDTESYGRFEDGIETEQLTLEEQAGDVEAGTDARDLNFELKNSYRNVEPEPIGAQFGLSKNLIPLHRQRFNADIFSESNRYERILVGGNDVGESVANGVMTVENTSGGFSSQGYDTGIQPPAPFCTVVARVESHTGTVGTGGEASDLHVGWIKDSDNMVLGGYNTSGGNFQIFEKDSETGGTNTAIGGVPPSGTFDMLVGLHGDEVHLAYRDPTETHTDWNWVGFAEANFDAKNDLYDATVFDDYSLCWRMATADTQTLEVSELAAFHSFGTGIAGPNPVTFRDGAPFIENNRLFFTITARGGNTRGIQCIASIDKDNHDVELEGVLFATVEGSDYLSNYVASHIVFDEAENRFLVCWSAFGNGPNDPRHDYSPARPVFLSKTRRSILSGAHLLDAEPMNLPRNGPSHDPFLIYDNSASAWRIIYNSDLVGEISTAETADDSLTTGWEQLGSVTESSADIEGCTIARVNGEYVCAFADGSASSLMVWADYPDLANPTAISLDRNTGDPDAPWPSVVPIPEGDQTRYLMLTMDQTSLDVMGATHQGALLVYEASERADGYEYDHRKIRRVN